MKVDEQLKCKDCDWYGSCEYYDRRKETSQICKMFNNTWKFVAELEKIKAEIQERANECQDYQTYINGLMYTYSIIDKHISEMKGESNERGNT